MPEEGCRVRGGEREHGDPRTVRGHFAALDRVVVEEEEAVGPEVEFGSRGEKILAFGLPVDFPEDEVVAAKDHIGAGEDGLHILLAVLREQDQEHALALAVEQELLRFAPGAGQVDLGGAGFGRHAAPEGIVGIDGDDFAGPLQQGARMTHQQRTGGGPPVRRKRNMAVPVAGRVLG